MPYFSMNAWPRGSRSGWRDSGHGPAIGRLNVKPEPIGQPVAECGAERRAIQMDQKSMPVAPISAPMPTRAAQAGKQQRKEGERFAEREAENDRRRPDLVIAHEFDDGLGVDVEAGEHDNHGNGVAGWSLSAQRDQETTRPRHSPLSRPVTIWTMTVVYPTGLIRPFPDPRRTIRIHGKNH